MALVVEETDEEGRAIFFQSNADISKVSSFNISDIDTMEKMNKIFEQKTTQNPKSRCYIYCYASFLTICAAGIRKKHKVQQKINYADIKCMNPCEKDQNIIFMVIKQSKSKYQLRVIRLPSSEKATKMRFVIDQIQLNPFNICDKSSREGELSKNDAESDGADSFTSASHPGRLNKALYNEDLEQNWNSVFGNDIPRIPRVQPYQLSESWNQKSVPRRKIRENEKPQTKNLISSSDYTIYRPRIDMISRESMYNQKTVFNITNSNPKQRIARHPLCDSSDTSTSWKDDEIIRGNRRDSYRKKSPYRYEEPPTFSFGDYSDYQRSMSVGRRRYRKY